MLATSTYVNSHVGPSSLYDTYSSELPTDQTDAFAREAVKSHLIPEAVSELFFSAFNIDLMHDAIRYMVYKRSGDKYVIEKQSDIDLKIIMRAMYMTHCKHLPYDIVGQTKELNKMVMDEAVQRILVEIPMYLYYRSDVISMRQPIDRAVNVSSAGTKTLELMRIV
jgi:hypothetical protein